MQSICDTKDLTEKVLESIPFHFYWIQMYKERRQIGLTILSTHRAKQSLQLAQRLDEELYQEWLQSLLEGHRIDVETILSKDAVESYNLVTGEW